MRRCFDIPIVAELTFSSQTSLSPPSLQEPGRFPPLVPVAEWKRAEKRLSCPRHLYLQKERIAWSHLPSDGFGVVVLFSFGGMGLLPGRMRAHGTAGTSPVRAAAPACECQARALRPRCYAASLPTNI